MSTNTTEISAEQMALEKGIVIIADAIGFLEYARQHPEVNGELCLITQQELEDEFNWIDDETGSFEPNVIWISPCAGLLGTRMVEWGKQGHLFVTSHEKYKAHTIIVFMGDGVIFRHTA